MGEILKAKKNTAKMFDLYFYTIKSFNYPEKHQETFYNYFISYHLVYLLFFESLANLKHYTL